MIKHKHIKEAQNKYIKALREQNQDLSTYNATDFLMGFHAGAKYERERQSLLTCSLDGNTLMVVNKNFVNLQESPAIFLDLTEEQIKEIRRLKAMTIYCEQCGDIPLNYVTINNENLCCKCAKKLYDLKLKKLNEEFAGV